MSSERAEQVVKHVHITIPEAAVGVMSVVTVGVGIVAARPLIAIGGGLIGLYEGLRVSFREAYEKARQKSELEEQGDVVGK